MSQDPYYLPQSFYDFAFMPRFDDNIEHLAELAEPEDWDYKNTPSDKLKPILHNFIKYTYKRISEEKKVAVSANEQYACWNTGLITPNQEPIYILFEKNRLDNATTYWHFSKFVRRGEWGNIQLLLPLCLTDPTKADLALVLENFNDFYRASTCLTLDMAYNNARQITRPDREWLKP